MRAMDVTASVSSACSAYADTAGHRAELEHLRPGTLGAFRSKLGAAYGNSSNINAMSASEGIF